MVLRSGVLLDVLVGIDPCYEKVNSIGGNASEGLQLTQFRELT